MASSVVEAMEPGLREGVRKRLQKVVTLIHGLEEIRKSQIPLILCTDLNSFPDRLVVNRSHRQISNHNIMYIIGNVYTISCTLISNSTILHPSHPLKFLLRCGTVPCKTDEKTDPCGIYSKLKLEHSLNLKSAYKSLLHAEGVEEHQRRKMDPNTLEPLLTCLTPTFSGSIDYILYLGECFTVNGVLEPLDRESIGAIGIPTAQWSSDHVALMAKFTLTSSPATGSVLPPLPLDPWEQGSTSKPFVTVTKVQMAK